MTEPLRDLVLDIYDTIADPSGWSKVLDRLADKVSARGIILFELFEKGGERRLGALYFNSIFKPEIVYPYMKYFKDYEIEEQDIVTSLMSDSDQIEIIRDSEIFDTEEERASRANVQAFAAFDIHHRAFALLDKDSKMRARFSVQHSADHGPITEAEEAELRQYLPHVAKALELGRPTAQLTQAHDSLKVALDRLKVGVCAMDTQGVVMMANEEFERQRREYGVFQLDRDNVLRLAKPGDQDRLRRLIDDALTHGEFGARPRKEALTIEVGPDPSALCIEVAPLGNLSVLGDTGFGGAILYSLDAGQPVEVNIEPMRQVYKLTKAECELAELLGRGLTNAQIADERGRAVATINAQVKSLLAKTDADNRTQFVRLLMSFGADYVK